MKFVKEVDMPKIVPFDTLAYAKKLEARGIDVQHAEAHAEVLAETWEHAFCTQQDTALAINQLSKEMTAGFVTVDARFVTLQNEMDAKFAKVDARFVTLQNEMDAKFARVDARFVSLQNEMDARFVSLHNEMDAKFAAVHHKMDAGFTRIDKEFVAIRSEMAVGFYKQKWEILRWVFGIAFAQTGLMFSMLKLLH